LLKKVKHQRVLLLTLLTSALLPINFVLKLDVFVPFKHVLGGIFPIANIVLVTEHNCTGSKR